MEKYPPNIEYKSTEDLKDQIVEVEKIANEHIAPDSVPADDIYKMSLDEIKSNFPLRYELYLDLLRLNRKNYNPDNLEDNEIKDIKKWLSILNSLDKYDISYRNEVSEDPRHPKQQEVFSEIRTFLEHGKRSGYIKLPTGSGKTIIFKRFLEAVQARSLIVVPNNVLVDQTARQLNKSTLSNNVGVVNMDSKDFSSMCTITTYASLIINLKKGELNPDDYSFLILDEAHKALGEETTKAIKQFSNTVKIGFTATPEYTSEKGVSQLFEHEIYRMNVDEAIRAGMLSSARTWVVKTDIDLSSVPIKNGEYVVGELEQKLNVLARNMAAVEHYKQYFIGRQGVAYCVTIAHANDVKRLFLEMGVEAEVISGKCTQSEKKEILRRYETGEIKILCNADILIEGFDNSKAGVCLNLRPTMSAVIAEQRGGRVLRLDSDDPEKIGYVVDFLDNDQLAVKQNRPTPILYREVLGATAVPRAVSSKSDPASLKKGPLAPGGDLDDYSNIDLKIISTEEQYKEILQQKEEYKRLINSKEEDKKQKTEVLEKIRQLFESYSRIGPEFDHTVDEAQGTAGLLLNTVSRNLALKKIINELQRVRRTFYANMGYLSRANHHSNIVDIPEAEDFKVKADSLYNQVKNLKSEWDIVREREEIRNLLRQAQEEKLRENSSEEAKNWLPFTKAELKENAKRFGVDMGYLSQKINELEKEHKEWVTFKKEDNGTFARRYSPLFFEEIEYRIFLTSVQKEMVSRGKENRVSGWKTTQDMHDFVNNLGLEPDQVSSAIKSIAMDHPSWVALRESTQGDLVYVYSPEFFDKFETNVLNKIV